MSISTYKVTKKSAHIQVVSLDMCRLNYGLSLYRDFFSALITSARFFYAIKAGLFRMVTMSTLAAHSPSFLSHTTHRKSAPEMDALLTIFKE